jgi:hypothetical protein
MVRLRYFCVPCKGLEIDTDNYRWETAHRGLLQPCQESSDGYPNFDFE